MRQVATKDERRDSSRRRAQAEIDRAEVEEIQRRLRGIEAGERRTVSWEEVERRLLSR